MRKDQLVANFAFATWTKSSRIRKPATFLGFRKDKRPKDVAREVLKPVGLNEEEIHTMKNITKKP
jgi:bifunctional non-homologous end joining protein LigD